MKPSRIYGIRTQVDSDDHIEWSLKLDKTITNLKEQIDELTNDKILNRTKLSLIVAILPRYAVSDFFDSERDVIESDTVFDCLYRNKNAYDVCLK
jgi:hypothetical protein